MESSPFTPAPTPTPQPNLAHILVVEDDVVQRHLLSEWLRSLHYAVHEATTTDEAAVLLASPFITVDLVIADMRLPGRIEGTDLAHYIRRAFPQLPLIVISGMDRPDDLGPTAIFYRKPYNLEDIAKRISALLAGKKG